MDYKTLLKRAREQLPEIKETTERFDVPRVQGMIQGNKTIITNFTKISQYIRRDSKKLLKYLNKELAAPGELQGQKAIFIGKFNSQIFNEKIKKYVKEYVLCRECGKPDTKIIKEGRITFLKCGACGAKYSIK